MSINYVSRITASIASGKRVLCIGAKTLWSQDDTENPNILPSYTLNIVMDDTVSDKLRLFAPINTTIKHLHNKRIYILTPLNIHNVINGRGKTQSYVNYMKNTQIIVLESC